MDGEDAFVFDNVIQTVDQSYDMFAIRRTICQMLHDRFYSLPALDAEDFTYESFLQRWNNKTNKDLTILACRIDDDNKKIGVFFPANPPDAKTRKLSVDIVRQVLNLMKEQAVTRGILVVEKPLMGHAEQTIQMEHEAQKLQGIQDPLRIETFLADEIKVNITRHELVPAHRVLTEDQKKQLLKRYHLQEKHLPRIQKNDPIARYYGLERRQVVRIERASETAGRYLTYRLVA